ncbi:hypothetical protein [Rubritalea sp.]|uniref:hypothetical protein n=1 Tax=Rubritalea sp. TaxID=2109375 RepID=UPI003EF1A205
MPHCRHCGFPLENQSSCPKCQTSREDMGRNAMYEVDVAHSGETWELAQQKIIHALDQAVYGHFKGVKVIHGYGSLSGQSVIAPRAISLMRHLAEQYEARFAKDQKNPGASIIWLNKAGGKQPDEEKPFFSTQTKNTPTENWFDQAMKRSQK